MPNTYKTSLTHRGILGACIWTIHPLGWGGGPLHWYSFSATNFKCFQENSSTWCGTGHFITRPSWPASGAQTTTATSPGPWRSGGGCSRSNPISGSSLTRKYSQHGSGLWSGDQPVESVEYQTEEIDFRLHSTVHDSYNCLKRRSMGPMTPWPTRRQGYLYCGSGPTKVLHIILFKGLRH